MSSHSWFDVWSRTSVQMVDSMIQVNRAATRALTPHAASGDSDDSQGSDRVEDRIEADADLPEWDVELHAGETIGVGDFVRFSKTLSDQDVQRFAAASGDTNPLHLDEAWAENTRFNGRIVHGILASGLISAALARLPGGVVYLSQDLEFQAPVRIGDRVTAVIEVAENLGGGRFRLSTTVEKGDTAVIEGEAVVLIDDDPTDD